MRSHEEAKASSLNIKRQWRLSPPLTTMRWLFLRKQMLSLAKNGHGLGRRMMKRPLEIVNDNVQRKRTKPMQLVSMANTIHRRMRTKSSKNNMIAGEEQRYWVVFLRIPPSFGSWYQ
jgi:hypothetical protein